MGENETNFRLQHSHQAINAETSGIDTILSTRTSRRIASPSSVLVEFQEFAGCVSMKIEESSPSKFVVCEGAHACRAKKHKTDETESSIGARRVTELRNSFVSGIAFFITFDMNQETPSTVEKVTFAELRGGSNSLPPRFRFREKP